MKSNQENLLGPSNSGQTAPMITLVPAAVLSEPTTTTELPKADEGAPSSTNEAGVCHPRLAFSIRETAQILGVSEKTVRRLIDRKLLRASLALRHKLIPKKEIERFLVETMN